MQATDTHIVLTTDAPGTPGYLEATRGRVSASIVPWVLGVGRGTKKAAWAISTGRYKADLSHRPEVIRGRILEPVIASEWEKQRGQKLLPTPGTVTRAGFEFICATPDRITERGSTWEAKSIGPWAKRDWIKGVPVAARVQGHTQALLYAPDKPVCFAGLHLPDEDQRRANPDDYDAEPLLWLDDAPDKSFREMIVNEVGAFHANFIVKDIEPPSESEKDLEIVKALHAGTASMSVQLDAALDDTIDQWLKAKKDGNEAEKRRRLFEARIRDKMGDAGLGYSPKFTLVLKTIERAGYTVAPTAYRQLDADPR